MKSFGMRAMAEASKARERVKEAAANGAAFIESNLGTGTAGQLVVTSDSDDDGFPFGGAIGSARKPPRTPSSGRKNSSSEPTTPVGSNTPREDGVFVPTSSAVKLKFFDSNDMAGVVRAHLEEKMALAEEHEKLMLALERLVDGNREDARRRVQMLLPEEIKQAASAARETEHGANRVALVSALHELASLKKALANAQQMAEKAASAFTDDDTAATAGGHEKIAKEGSTDGWSDDGWSGDEHDEHDETKTDDEKTLESLRQRIKTLEAQQAAERFTFLKRASALEAAGEVTETAATDAVEEAERLLRVSEGEKHVLAEKVEALQIDLQTTREDLEKRETLDNAKKKSDSSKQRYEEVQVLESANVALEAELARAKREVIRLSGERESFVKQIESLSGTLETSKKKIDVLVVGNAAGENRVAALGKETKQFAIDLKTREAEKAELELEKAELEKAQSSVSASESDKLTTLETRQKETIKTLKKLTKGKTDAESKLESVSKKLETVLSELESVSKEKQASEAELKTLREAHEAAREAHKTVLAEHKTVLAEHETAAAAALETVTKESKDDSDSCDTIAQLKSELQSVLHAKSAAETAEAYAEEASAKDAETIAALKKTVDELRFSVNEAEKNLSATEVAEANAEEAAAASAIEAKALRGVVEDLKSQIAAHVSKKRNASKLNEALEMVKVELETARIGERSAETAREEALERIAALTNAQTKASIALDELTVQLAAAEKGRAEAEAKASSLEKTVESAVFDAKTEADGALEVKRLECETAAARAASVEAEARSATTAAVERVTVAEERVVLAELARDNAERELLNAAKLARASAARADAAESASRRHLEEASAAVAEADDAASLAVEFEQCRVRESDLETKVAEQQVMLNAASAAAAFAETRIAAAAADAAIAFEGNTWVSELLKVERGRADESQAARLRENAAAETRVAAVTEKLASQIEALETRLRESQLAAREAAGLATRTQTQAETFRQKARLMLEAKDVELEGMAARMVDRENENVGAADACDKSGTDCEAAAATETNENGAATLTHDDESIEQVAGGDTVDDPASAENDAANTLANGLDDANARYIRNVLCVYLTTDDWEKQDSLVPVIGALVGFSPDDFQNVKTKRDELAPLDIRVGRYIG